jgi:hypothetical protein
VISEAAETLLTRLEARLQPARGAAP